MKKIDMLKLQFTEKGLEDMRTRFKTLIRLFNEEKFNLNAYILGFGEINIESKEELLGRIKELSEILGENFKIEKTLIKLEDGTTKQKEVIWQ